MTELVEKILDGMDDNYLHEAMKYEINHKAMRKNIATALGRMAACIVCIVGVSGSCLFMAVAAGNMTAYDALYTIYPDIAIKLMPVYASCVDGGIRMEVEGVSVRDNCAYIYISMQDLEGIRLDESIDLFDSYSIHTNADQIGGCTLVDFDEESKKATFLITVQHLDGTSIEGSAITFSVSQILTGKNEMLAELTQICPDEISEVTRTQTKEGLDIRGGSYTDGYVPSEITEEYLYTDESKLFVPTPGVTVTNYGFVNDKLHVQVHYEDILKFDNHGYVYLSDADENNILPECSTAFWDEEKQGSYEEYIFDVSANILKRYKVYGHFITCRNLVEGDWEVRFTIKNQ